MKDIYNDINNELKDLILDDNQLTVLNEEEYKLYKNFIETNKNGKVNGDIFGKRIMNKEYFLYNLFSPFFYNERFITFLKIKEFKMMISFGDDYEETKVVINDYIYIVNFEQNWYPIFKSISKFLNKHYEFKLKPEIHRSKVFIKRDFETSEEEILLVSNKFNFKVPDVSIFKSRNFGKWKKYVSFDETILCPARYTENNDQNRLYILRSLKEHGLGMDAFVPGMKFTETEVKRYIIPSFSKNKNIFMFGDKESFFLKFIETQNHLSDDTIIDIINQLTQNNSFVKKLKNSKRIANKYSNRPSITLFIHVL
jgi:hypothetical protein